MSCDDARYKGLLAPVLALLIGDVFGAPLVFALLLVCKRRQLITLSGPLENAADHSAATSTPPSALGVLYEPYKATPAAFLWAAVILIRRSTLVAADTGLFGDLTMKYMAFSLLNLLFLLVHLLVQPYRSWLQNHTETASLSVLTVVSIILCAQPPPLATAIDDTVTVIVIFTAIVVGLTMAFAQLRNKLCRSKLKTTSTSADRDHEAQTKQEQEVQVEFGVSAMTAPSTSA